MDFSIEARLTNGIDSWAIGTEKDIADVVSLVRMRSPCPVNKGANELADWSREGSVGKFKEKAESF